MSGQIIFFKKNKADFGYTWVSATASEGNDFAPLALNRSNNSAWITSGSVDANNTTLTVDIGDSRAITDLVLIKHNFKSFKVEWFDGVLYQPFSPAIDVTNNTATSHYFPVSLVSTARIRITVRGTVIANSDKFLYQFIMTEKIGQLKGWPKIQKPILSRNKRKSQMLSGKMNIQENIGFFSCTLQVDNWKDDTDMTIVESLYNQSEGFLVWLSGGDETQFSTRRQGYLLENLPLMKCANEYTPEWVNGLYKSGMKISIDLDEVID